MDIHLTGAAIVRRDGYISLGTKSQKVNPDRPFPVDLLKEMFTQRSSRVGRFDQYTRMGCAAAGLALRDAGREPDDQLRNIGFILSSRYGSFTTDINYYQTTTDANRLASPHLFSYTLPNVVIGECALQFRMIGPTFCLDSRKERGYEALHYAASCFQDPEVEAMLAGWLDVVPEKAPAYEGGAVVLFLDRESRNDNGSLTLTTDSMFRLCLPNGKAVTGLDELIRMLPISDHAGYKQKRQKNR